LERSTGRYALFGADVLSAVRYTLVRVWCIAFLSTYTVFTWCLLVYRVVVPFRMRRRLLCGETLRL